MTMKVLVLGLPRTGTQSIADALKQLGISPIYHMREVGKNQHQDLWIQALEAKFENKGEAWSIEDFEQVLAGFEGVADYPAAIFAEELINAYPEARIILSVRPEDSWYASMLATLWHHHCARLKPGAAEASSAGSMARLADKYHAHCWGDDFPAHGRECFQRHNELVRRLAAGVGGGARDFLEYDVREGWAPLCEFLGVAIPEGPLPRSDDWAEYKRRAAGEESLG